MASFNAKQITDIIMIAGPIPAGALVGGIITWGLQEAIDSVIHDKKWLMPVAGAVAGGIVGALFVYGNPRTT